MQLFLKVLSFIHFVGSGNIYKIERIIKQVSPFCLSFRLNLPFDFH